ncbi:MAG: four helix bundle protein [Oscillospiraceae bacterium]|nr:four helix bundle protein [Oscillospiraceae bacterium]
MDSIIRSKSFRFALRIIKLCNYLRDVKSEYTMSKQLLRSGTSIGANVAEAKHAQSRPDFASKMNIALKEAAETDYWLRLLREANYLTEIQFASIIRDCDELERMLAATVKTVKK